MDALITTVVEDMLVPLITAVTAPIPFLAGSGALLVMFAALWLAFAVALIREPARIDAAWLRLRRLPLIVQAVAWLLFLPILAGAWIWRASWPRGARLLVVASIAAWNLLVFLPA